jgi:lambda family phage minor tail protein L
MRTLSTEFRAEKEKLTNRPIRLFIIEAGSLGLTILRYAEYGQDVVFPTTAGNTYYAVPIQSEPVTENMSQEVDSVTVSIANVDRALTYYLELYDGLRGSKVTIRTVFADLLDHADAFTDDIFYVASSSISAQVAVFNLKSKMDLLNVTIPLRRFYREVCQWKFGGTECGYTILGAETCNRTLTRCKALSNSARFGGFPGAGKGTLHRLPRNECPYPRFLFLENVSGR